VKGTVAISTIDALTHPDDVTDTGTDGTAEDLLIHHVGWIGKYRSQGMGGPRRSFLTRRWLPR
jgi:hypothetical protein